MRLSELEKAQLMLPWQAVREGVDVRLLPQEPELYVLAQSGARIHKERAKRLGNPICVGEDNKVVMDRAGGIAYEARCRARQGAGGMASNRDRSGFRCCHVQLRTQSQEAAPGAAARRTLSPAHQSVRTDPAQLWQFYIQLIEVEPASRA